LVSAKTDFLTFGPGEFELSEKEEAKYLEHCRSGIYYDNLLMGLDIEE
jgi:hypothetical protein